MKGKILLLSIVLMFATSSYGQSGQDGNISWRISNDTLTISGIGDMSEYNEYSYPFKETPWFSYKRIIKKIIVEEGITRIGSSSFKSCSYLTSVDIANSVTSIGDLHLIIAVCCQI